MSKESDNSTLNLWIQQFPHLLIFHLKLVVTVGKFELPQIEQKGGINSIFCRILVGVSINHVTPGGIVAFYQFF